MSAITDFSDYVDKLISQIMPNVGLDEIMSVTNTHFQVQHGKFVGEVAIRNNTSVNGGVVALFMYVSEMLTENNVTFNTIVCKAEIQDRKFKWGFRNSTNLSGGWQDNPDINGLFKFPLWMEFHQLIDSQVELASPDPNLILVCDEVEMEWKKVRTRIGWSPSQPDTHVVEDS